MSEVPDKIKIGAFILSVGQLTKKDCVASLFNQVDYLELVENVSPVNKAVQKCFNQAQKLDLEYFIIVGADTVHYENSIKTMMSYMTDELWCVMGKLDDYYRGNEGYGNHLYRTEAIKGYKIDQNDPMYDHKIHVAMAEKGLKKVLTDKTIGKHHPVWTCEEAFRKHLFSGWRYKPEDSLYYYIQVKKRHEQDPCFVNLSAVMGFEIGMEKQRQGIKTPTLSSNERCKEWEKFKNSINYCEILTW